VDVPSPSSQVLTSYLDGSCSSVFYYGLFYVWIFFIFFLVRDPVFPLTKK